jgi:hypothetical protein
MLTHVLMQLLQYNQLPCRACDVAAAVSALSSVLMLPLPLQPLSQCCASAMHAHPGEHDASVHDADVMMMLFLILPLPLL